MVADELRRQADQFIDLADLGPIICREPSARTARAAGRVGHGPARGSSEGPVPFEGDDDLPEEL
jgi:hypothetical protein